MLLESQSCTHTTGKTVPARAESCEGCGQTFNLRICQTCGHTGCCESSPGTHAKAHFEETGHAVMKSNPPDGPGAFTWCYACNTYA